MMSLSTQQQALKDLIEETKEIAIFWHDNPDGDAIGSMLGLGRILEKLWKRVSYFAYPTPSKVFTIVPHIEKIQSEFDYSARYDLIIFVDFSPYYRTAFSAGNYDYFDQKRLLIFDHHIGETPSHALVFKNEKSDSNCEWIFQHVRTIWEEHLDPLIASYFYMGVLTDTGNFSYDKNGDSSLRAGADLVALGAEKLKLTRHFESISFAQMRFFHTIFDRLHTQGTVASVYFTVNDYESLWLDKDQTDILIFLLTKLEWFDFFLFCRYDGDALKISLRSKHPNKSAQRVASSLGGGGHHYAAGVKVPLQIGEDPHARIQEIIDSLPHIFAHEHSA